MRKWFRLCELSLVLKRVFGLLSTRSEHAQLKGVLPSGLEERVDDDETLARILTTSRHFNAKMVVKPAAFMPNPKDRKKSVIRHAGNPSDELWQIGREMLGENVPMHGAALVKAFYVRAAHLEVSSDEPPPRHANIENWPWPEGDPEEAKARQMECAQQIAQHAKLLVRH